MYRHLLVPVDGADASIEALGQAVEFAQSIGARITFCPLPAALTGSRLDAGVDRDAQPADGEMTRELLVRAEAAARAQGVPCSLATPGANAPLPLAALAHAQGCDLICVAPRPAAAGTSADGTTTVDGGGIAVLVCAIDSRPAVVRAIGILLAGQRAISAHLHAALRAARVSRGTNPQYEPTTLHALASRLNELKPKQNAMTEALFARLRERTSAVDAELDELGRQHQRAMQMFDELGPLIASNDEFAATAVRLEEGLRACAQFTWENMGRKEGVVLPAARRYLSDTDWNALAQAFGAGCADEQPNTRTL
ncbi:universal stress protein [Paraburkholderia aromaticivorans]|uniref:UspA domain-containing protein n=1 Tax=Paraburkholderia aromaticivorans TaxID=2026199 RepID=A0A248VSD0_9BURK|nr:universal stress protein [Paraburkholderia aromaticivorans]ASW01907.1 hypothetical protein CJU94_27640 [Paraburkholderia aromaticivorans]